MKPYQRLFVMALFLAGANIASHAQVSQGGTPYSFSIPIHRNLHTVVMPPVNVQQLLGEDEQEERSGIPIPLRFGFAFDVNLGLTNAGTWDTLSNGDRLWRLRIRCPGAYSINLIYDTYFLPKWATLYIYNEDRSYLIGAFTSDNNQQHGQFSTQPVPGSAITLEYYEPANAHGLGRINISNVIHAYRPTFNKRAWRTGAPDNLLGKILNFGASGPCNINVRCPEWAAWDQQIRSVAMILTSTGTRLCSGALISNTRQDLTPYFLTANHCLTGNPNTWIIMFNYESPGCTSVDGPTNQTVSGTTTLANNAASDFALLRLTERPPGRYRTFYAGWAATGSIPQFSVGIHHPRGDIKKISFDQHPAVSSRWTLGYTSPPDSHWEVYFDGGTVEHGSSGSPLFDPSRRIIGQLHGNQNPRFTGRNYCEVPHAWYGKFSVSWNYGGSSSTRLKDWLDPTNSGALTLDGMEGPPTEPTNVVITNPNQIGSSPQLSWSPSSSPHGIAYYQVYRCASFYNPCNWSLIGTSTTTSYTDHGIIIRDQTSARDRFSYRVAVVDTRGFSSDPSGLPYANVWGDPMFKLADTSSQAPKIPTALTFELNQNYPNPFNPRTEIEFSLPKRAQVSLVIYNVMGREVARLLNGVKEPGHYRLSWDASDQPSGVYFYRLTAEGLIQTRYMILLR